MMLLVHLASAKHRLRLSAPNPGALPFQQRGLWACWKGCRGGLAAEPPQPGSSICGRGLLRRQAAVRCAAPGGPGCRWSPRASWRGAGALCRAEAAVGSRARQQVRQAPRPPPPRPQGLQVGPACLRRVAYLLPCRVCTQRWRKWPRRRRSERGRRAIQPQYLAEGCPASPGRMMVCGRNDVLDGSRPSWALSVH
jgi:hypothetical protein